MSQFSISMLTLFTIIMVIGLIYTIRIGQTQGQNNRSEFDSDINDVVEAQPYTRNPVFWAYIIGLGAAFLYILYRMV